MNDNEFNEFIKKTELTGSWEDFKCYVKQIKECTDYLQEYQKKSPSFPNYKWFSFYRGHKNYSWKLETTLQRSGFEQDFNSYHKLVFETYKKYTDLTKCTKKINKYLYNEDCQDIISLFKRENIISQIPDYLLFWIFLRHYSFPSPFLDWTKNYLVAAFFAFREKSDEESSSIHIFIPNNCGSTGPNLIIIDDTHQNENKDYIWVSRHQAQQSVYTMFYHDDNKPSFKSYEEMIEENIELNNSWGFHFIFKISSSEREKILLELDSKKINAASLFDNTEGYLEAIYNKIIFEKTSFK